MIDNQMRAASVIKWMNDHPNQSLDYQWGRDLEAYIKELEQELQQAHNANA